MLIPPKVKNYLDVDINDMYDGDNADELMLEHLSFQTY